MSVWAELPAVWLDALEESNFLGLVVLNTTPEENSTGAAIDTLVELDFHSTDPTEAINALTVEIYIEGTIAYDGDGGGFQPGYDGPSSNILVVPGGIRYIIDPTTDFTSEQVVDVRAVATSAAPATHSVDYTYSFTIEDVVEPSLVLARAVYADRIQVTFDEAMLATSAAGANDALNPALYSFAFIPASPYEAAVDVNASSVVRVSDTVYEITTDIELTFGKQYRITCGDIADDAGNLLRSDSRDYEFTAWIPPDWPEQRDFNLWAMYSDDDRDGDAHGDLERLLSAMQDVVDLLLWQQDQFGTIWDVDKCAEEWLDAMLAELGNPFNLDLSLSRKRKLVDVLVEIYRQKGTAVGIINVARFFLGLTVTITQPNLDSWLLGEDTLGETTFLGPSNEALLYSFSVHVDHILSDEDAVALYQLVDYTKPAHTHFAIVQPEVPAIISHWSLGESGLGEETILHE